VHRFYRSDALPDTILHGLSLSALTVTSEGEVASLHLEVIVDEGE